VTVRGTRGARERGEARKREAKRERECGRVGGGQPASCEIRASKAT